MITSDRPRSSISPWTSEGIREPGRLWRPKSSKLDRCRIGDAKRIQTKSLRKMHLSKRGPGFNRLMRRPRRAPSSSRRSWKLTSMNCSGKWRRDRCRT